MTFNETCINAGVESDQIIGRYSYVGCDYLYPAYIRTQIPYYGLGYFAQRDEYFIYNSEYKVQARCNSSNITYCMMSRNPQWQVLNRTSGKYEIENLVISECQDVDKQCVNQHGDYCLDVNDASFASYGGRYRFDGCVNGKFPTFAHYKSSNGQNTNGSCVIAFDEINNFFQIEGPLGTYATCNALLFDECNGFWLPKDRDFVLYNCGIQPSLTGIPTTQIPTTNEPIKSDAPLASPTTNNPTTRDLNTVNITTANPTTNNPSTVETMTSEPTISDPITIKPTSSEPTIADSTTSNPTQSVPTRSAPTTANPTIANLISVKPTTSGPTTSTEDIVPGITQQEGTVVEFYQPTISPSPSSIEVYEEIGVVGDNADIWDLYWYIFVAGVSGLIVCIVCCIIGFIVYRKKNYGRVRLRTYSRADIDDPDPGRIM